MAVELSPTQRELITEIAGKEGIEDYQLETTEGGEGSFGYIKAVTLTGNDKKMELIVKSASTDDKVRSVNPVRGAYLREIYVYEAIFPAYCEFEREHGVEDGFSSYPKMYGNVQYENQECLVLENLNKSGYKLWDCKIPMNEDHVSLIFKEYAKFHAVSFAMSYKKPCDYYDLTNDLTNVFESHSLVMARAALEYGRKAVIGNSIATKAIERLTAVVEHFLTHDLEQLGSKLVVIHKDGWCNNMMFKYEDNSNPQTPTKVCLLDWQLAKTGSPILDLVYFFFASSSKDILYDYKTYLKIYHETFSENLRKLSCDPEEIFPYALLESHWKKYAKFGLYIALIVITVMVSDAEEAPVFKEVVKTGGTIFNTFDYESINDNSNPQTPTKVCLLDWQLAKTGSPVLDLAYFFFACSSKDILYDYKAYLKLYHETVSENLRKLSCDPEEIFPYALLESHWKKYAKFGLYMALIVITVMVSDAEEAPVLKDVVKTNDTIFDTFNYESIHVSEYNQRILDIVTFLAEQELI